MGNQALMRLLGPSRENEKTNSAPNAPPLTINEPGDRFEREADAVADQVMRTPSSTLSGGAKSLSSGDDENKLQRQPSERASQIAVQRTCSQCE